MGDFDLNATVDRLITELTRLPPGERYILAIAGIPGSGKTTLADSLARRVNEVYRARVKTREGTEGPVSIALSMDGFHLTKQQLAKFEDPDEAFRRRGAPWTFDPDALLTHLQKLRSPHYPTVLWPSFDHAIGDPTPDDLTITPNHHLIILEGNYLLYHSPTTPWSHLPPLYTESWFVTCPHPIAQKRLVARHLTAKIEPDYDRALHRVLHNDLLNADLILDNLTPPDLTITITPST